MININKDPAIRGKIEDLLEVPIILKVNKFDEDSAGKFEEAFNKAQNAKQSVIPIIIDSYGGYVYSLLSMLSVIKTSKVPVATIALGKAMSCGSVLLSAGTEGYRFMAPHSTVMIHDVSSWAVGKIEELKADVKETERLQQMLFAILAENVGKPTDYFSNIVHEKGHADWFLDAGECKAHNLVNHIRIPAFQIDLSVKTSFG